MRASLLYFGGFYDVLPGIQNMAPMPIMVPFTVTILVIHCCDAFWVSCMHAGITCGCTYHVL